MSSVPRIKLAHNLSRLAPFRLDSGARLTGDVEMIGERLCAEFPDLTSRKSFTAHDLLPSSILNGSESKM